MVQSGNLEIIGLELVDPAAEAAVFVTHQRQDTNEVPKHTDTLAFACRAVRLFKKDHIGSDSTLVLERYNIDKQQNRGESLKRGDRDHVVIGMFGVVASQVRMTTDVFDTHWLEFEEGEYSGGDFTFEGWLQLPFDRGVKDLLLSKESSDVDPDAKVRIPHLLPIDID